MGFLPPDERVDPEAALLQALAYNGIPYRKEKDGARFAFCDGGRRWETVCRYAPQTVVVYGVYPFPVADRARALEGINAAGAALARGGLFLSGDRIVLRVGADLFDAYSAGEAVTRALEYSAGAMVHLWGRMANCAQGAGVFDRKGTNNQRNQEKTE